MLSKRDSLVISALLLATQACGGDKLRPVQVATPRSESPPISTPEISSGRETQAVVAISRDIRDACGITDPRAFFTYNSARVTAPTDALFRQLAACFGSGALKDRGMRLVGYTDPRGEDDYNYLLGQRRADSVKDAIVAAGLPGQRVGTTSRGENDATGQDEPGWAEDRRVEVQIGDVL